MDKLYSVIIVHYNQPKYWKTAISSILSQTYKNIQLIFADDGSDNFSPEEIEQFILKHKKSNIFSYKIIHNSQNGGTVQNINRALVECDGSYITVFAADDALYNDSVLWNFANALEKCSSDCGGVFARSLDCTETLQENGDEYIPRKEAIGFGSLSATQQFSKLTYRCCIHLGAMAFTQQMLQEYVPLDTRYRLIEDWPLLLRITRQGKHLEYADFPAILYRGGGISRPLKERPASITKAICVDHLNLHDFEILPYTKKLSFAQLKKVMDQYDRDRAWMKPLVSDFPSKKRITILSSDPRFILLLWGKLDDYQRRILGGGFASVGFIFCMCVIKALSFGPVFTICFGGYFLFINCYMIIPTLHEAFEKTKKYLFNPFE